MATRQTPLYLRMVAADRAESHAGLTENRRQSVHNAATIETINKRRNTHDPLPLHPPAGSAVRLRCPARPSHYQPRRHYRATAPSAGTGGYFHPDPLSARHEPPAHRQWPLRPATGHTLLESGKTLCQQSAHHRRWGQPVAGWRLAGHRCSRRR